MFEFIRKIPLFKNLLLVARRVVLDLTPKPLGRKARAKESYAGSDLLNITTQRTVALRTTSAYQTVSGDASSRRYSPQYYHQQTKKGTLQLAT